jgi:MFS family permease
LRIIEPEAMGRATGAFRASFLVGIAAGPLLGGVLASYLGLRAPFHIYATGLIVATVIAFFVMRGEARDVEVEKKRPLEALRAARPLFADIRYMVALLATFVGWWTISGPTQVIGVIYAREELLLTEFQVAVALTMLALGEIVVLYGAGKAADHFGRRAVLAPSLIVVAVATLLLGQIQDASWAFFPLTMLIGAGIAAGGTAAGGLLADSIPKGGSGTAVGVNQMAGDLGYLLSPTAIGAIAQSTSSYSTAYIVGSLPAFLVFAAALRLPRHPTGQGPELQAEPSASG